MSTFLKHFNALLRVSLLLCFSMSLSTSDLFAQTPTYQVFPAYCTFDGVSYHVAHPTDWNFYECNEEFIVKWKVYNKNCQLVSVTYGADSPNCLCDGTVQLEIMNKECLHWCEEFTLPPCRGGSEDSFTEGTDQLTNSDGSNTSNMACGNECGDYSGEPCNEYNVVLGNISYCLIEGINGTLLNVATGQAFDCVEDALIEWKHWVLNPLYPHLSNTKYIVNASGCGSDVGNCLCGGRVQIKVRTACCGQRVTYYVTPPCSTIGEDQRAQRISPDEGRTNTVFPNPASDQITIRLDEQETALVQVQIYAQDGRLVKALSDVEERSIDIAVDDLVPGIYWVQVIGTTRFTEKIIIQ